MASLVAIADLDRRFGAEVVTRALGVARRYVEPPKVDAAGRLVGTVIETPGGTKLTTPIRVVVRLTDEVVEVACACRNGRVCAHALWLLVDVAVDPDFGDELSPRRARLFEERTLDERLAAWRPSANVDDDLAIEIDVQAIEGRAAVFLKHRRGRSVIGAREVLAARLPTLHRQIVELTAPYHADRNLLVATRGPASVVVRLLRGLIGPRVRYADDDLRLKAEPAGDRLVARWYAGDVLVVDVEASHFLGGPYPYVWVPATKTFHPVSAEVDPDVALGMQRVPSLPMIEASGRALLSVGPARGVELPPPESFGLPPLVAPTFELRLTGTPLHVVGQLFAVYALGRFDVLARGERYCDRAAEATAVERVRRAGFSSSDDALVAIEDDAVKVWREGLAELRGAGFEVLVTDALARTRVGPPVEVDVSVAGEVGWLEAELGFRAGALKIEKGRMHAALAENRRWVVLGDGSLARIADDVAELVGKQEPSRIGTIARLFAASGAGVHLDGAAEALRARRRELGAAREPAMLNATLRSYQRVGLSWLELLRDLGAGGLLADDMGLGKTITTLAFLARWREDAGPAPCLVVCPTSLVGNWLREIERFTPELRPDLVITTYGRLRRDVARLAATRFRCVVLDEAQNVKTSTSETARCARKLDAEMRLALTGTPVENRLAELWSLMAFVNPGLLGPLGPFVERYERAIAHRPDGAMAAELKRLIGPFVLRRTKRDVLPDLPPKTEVDRPCVLTMAQRRSYDALALAVRESVRTNLKRRGDARVRTSVLTAILRLRQMACDPRLVDATFPAEASAKRTAFLDLVRELVAEDRRALVFSQFVELLALWREDLDAAKIDYEWLDGSTRDRDAVVDRFQKGRAPLFLISLKAGGAGLNLTAADTVIHCDPWWNPAVEDQATDRAHRIGQSRPVTVVRLVAQGTIEHKVGLLKEAKRELTAAIIGDGAGLGDLSSDLSNDEIEALLGDVDGDVEDDAES